MGYCCPFRVAGMGGKGVRLWQGSLRPNVARASQVAPLRLVFSAVVGGDAGVYCVGLWRCGGRHKWRPYVWQVISGIYERAPEAPFGGFRRFGVALRGGSDELDAAFEELVEGAAFEQSVLQEGDVDELVHHGLPGAVVGEHFGLLLFLGGDVLVAL